MIIYRCPIPSVQSTLFARPRHPHTISLSVTIVRAVQSLQKHPRNMHRRVICSTDRARVPNCCFIDGRCCLERGQRPVMLPHGFHKTQELRVTGEDVSGVGREAVACECTSALLRRNVVVGGKSPCVAGKLKAWLTILIAVDLTRLPMVVWHQGRGGVGPGLSSAVSCHRR